MDDRGVMSIPTSILCPVDFSPASLGGLHYALAIGRRFHIPLVVLTVIDPLLAAGGDARIGAGWTRATCQLELRELVEKTQQAPEPCGITCEVRIGKAAATILDVARERQCGMLVMSTHGMSGLRKWVLGATAERVLRGTTVPVLLTAADPGPLAFDDLVRRASPILLPVDFGIATAFQAHVAGRIAAAFHLELMIGHVLEPIGPLPFSGIDEGELLSERHNRTCHRLRTVAAAARLPHSTESLIAFGDPPDEIARWIREKRVGMVIMALHDAIDGGPRMGSVTYRTLVLGRALTLALPPTRSPAIAAAIESVAQVKVPLWS